MPKHIPSFGHHREKSPVGSEFQGASVLFEGARALPAIGTQPTATGSCPQLKSHLVLQYSWVMGQ